MLRRMLAKLRKAGIQTPMTLRWWHLIPLVGTVLTAGVAIVDPMIGFAVAVAVGVVGVITSAYRDNRSAREATADAEVRSVLSTGNPFAIAKIAIDRTPRPLTDKQREALKYEVGGGHWNRTGHHIVASGTIDSVSWAVTREHGTSAVHQNPSLVLERLVDLIIQHAARCPPDSERCPGESAQDENAS